MAASLEEAYAKIDSPGYLSSSVQQLYDIVNSGGGGKEKYTRVQIRDFLRGKEPYLLTKNATRKFTRNSYVFSGPNELAEADLVDMSKFSKENNGYTFLLTCIDCFSKFAACRPLKNKKADSVTAAFRQILNETRISPRILQTDRGVSKTCLMISTIRLKLFLLFRMNLTTLNSEHCSVFAGLSSDTH